MAATVNVHDLRSPHGRLALAVAPCMARVRLDPPTRTSARVLERIAGSA
jgi:hypothetical protein